MNAINQNAKTLVNPDAIVTAIVGACKPVWAAFDVSPQASRQNNDDGYRTALKRALESVGLPRSPAAALAVYEMLGSIAETRSSKQDDCEIFNSIEAAREYLRAQVGYAGDAHSEADRLARVSMLITDIRNEEFEPHFAMITLHEIWSDIRSVHAGT